ncbi:MAG: hypothetical protein KDE15_07010 [Erythrobacter sp.]|nr:hypothetical protein [Erythrobacter sp.]
MLTTSKWAGLAATTCALAAIAAGAAMAQGQTGAQPQADLPYVEARPTDIGSCRAPTSHAGTDRVLTCTCPAAAGDPSASAAVWGTDVYTADSYICATARHAGVIGTGGGRVTLQMLPGQASYAGTSRNGVSTRSYGRYGASYRYVTTERPVAAPPAPQPAPAVMPSAPSVPVQAAAPVAGLPDVAWSAVTDLADFDLAGGSSSSRRAQDLGQCTSVPPVHRGQAGVLLTCTCPADPGEGPPIWGTRYYSGDSNVCKAALHAGAIDRSGGRVAIMTMTDQDRYEGSTHNGVTSLAYGRTNRLGAYFFVR